MAITEKRNAGKDMNPVHAPAPIKKKKSKMSNWFTGILIVLVLAMFVGAYIVGRNSTAMPVTRVTNVFVDVNGDGKPDLILNADIILNNGQSSFPTSQP
jgi:hypothetical protein